MDQNYGLIKAVRSRLPWTEDQAITYIINFWLLFVV